MIGLDPVIELVLTVLWSGQVEGERPLSLILIAPPGSGKTSILETMQCSVAHFTSDLTSREIKNVLKQNGHHTHIMLGDFTAVFNRSRGTAKLTMNLLGRLTGDKITHMPWEGEALPVPKQLGFISAIPPHDLAKREVKNQVEGAGFASRFLFAKFRYSQETIELVHKYIREGKYKDTLKMKPFEIKPGAYKVSVPKEISRSVNDLANRIKKDPLGFRAHHHLRTLICSIARKNSRNIVTLEDYETLVQFCDFFQEDGKQI
jgi:hypothetical protein